jgi:hypothetical protein
VHVEQRVSRRAPDVALFCERRREESESRTYQLDERRRTSADGGVATAARQECSSVRQRLNTRGGRNTPAVHVGPGVERALAAPVKGSVVRLVEAHLDPLASKREGASGVGRDSISREDARSGWLPSGWR